MTKQFKPTIRPQLLQLVLCQGAGIASVSGPGKQECNLIGTMR